MSKERIRLSLRFLIYQEAALSFAHCLELDIVAEGESPKEAISHCVDLCSAQINYAYERGDLESIFRSAPAEFWRMFAVAQDYDFGTALPEPIEKAEARELVFA